MSGLTVLSQIPTSYLLSITLNLYVQKYPHDEELGLLQLTYTPTSLLIKLQN